MEAGQGFMPRLLNGRRVACSALLTGDGTWAEYMVASAQSCIPLNKAVSFEQGSMLLVNPLSALAIFEMAQPRQTSCHGQHGRGQRPGRDDPAPGETP